MKRLAILLFLATACGSAFGKIIVRGKIIAYDGKSKVAYIPTIEGIYAPYWLNVQPAPNGTFNIEYQNEGYGNVKVTYKSMTFRFFHDADSKIYFEFKEIPDWKSKQPKFSQERMYNVFDSLKKANIVKITGDYADINQFYNQNLRSSYYTTNMTHGNYYSWVIFRAPTPASALAKMDSLAQIEISQVEQMIGVEKSDPQVINFLKNEIYAFYAANFLNGLYLKRVTEIKARGSDSTARPNIYNRDWEILVEQMKDQLQALDPAPGSPDYTDFVEAMMMAMDEYQKYSFPKLENNTLDDWVSERLLHYDTTLLKDPKVRFGYELYGMNSFLGNQMMYSNTLLNAIKELQKKHPGSTHWKYYQPKIDALKAYLEKSVDSNIITDKYSTFPELIKRFEGKNVFIDIWATWCRPCIEEFKYRSVLEPFVSRKDLSVLYISVDKPQVEDRWKKSIAANDLDGTHFRADKDFINDMWRTIGGAPGVIPRYVLIDKEGKIFNPAASPPSHAPDLTKEVRLLLAQ